MKRLPSFNYPNIFKSTISSTLFSLPIAQAIALKLSLYSPGCQSLFSVLSNWPIRCFWHYWPLHSTLQTLSYFCHFWHCSVLVSIITQIEINHLTWLDLTCLCQWCFLRFCGQQSMLGPFVLFLFVFCLFVCCILHCSCFLSLAHTS